FLSSAPVRPSPRPTLFPYTTLFRSGAARLAHHRLRPSEHCRTRFGAPTEVRIRAAAARKLMVLWRGQGAGKQARRRLALQRVFRSEEHTSELQSRVDLVCRLLLEKK